MIKRYPKLWEFTNSEIMDELSRIEYYYGIIDYSESKTGIEKPYGGGCLTIEQRILGLFASVLLRTMKRLEMHKPEYEEDNEYIQKSDWRRNLETETFNKEKD